MVLVEKGAIASPLLPPRTTVGQVLALSAVMEVKVRVADSSPATAGTPPASLRPHPRSDRLVHKAAPSPERLPAPINSGSTGTVGIANTTANANGLNYGSAIAQGTGAGGFSTATATANSTGLISVLRTVASAPVDATGNALSLSETNVAAPLFASGATYQSTAQLIGTPLTTDVTVRWAPDSNVKNAFNNDATHVNALGIAELEYPSAGSGRFAYLQHGSGTQRK